MTRTLRTHARYRARLRAHYEAQLPVPCPFCGEPVMPGQQYDLDHAVPLAFGGTDADVRPAHSSCNRAAGRAIADTRRSVFRSLGPGVARTGPVSSLEPAETRDRDW